MGQGKGALRIIDSLNCEPIDDTNLCGSCRFGRPAFNLAHPELNGMFIWCNLWTSQFTIDDGCTSWKRKEECLPSTGQ